MGCEARVCKITLLGEERIVNPNLVKLAQVFFGRWGVSYDGEPIFECNRVLSFHDNRLISEVLDEITQVYKEETLRGSGCPIDIILNQGTEDWVATGLQNRIQEFRKQVVD